LHLKIIFWVIHINKTSVSLYAIFFEYKKARLHLRVFFGLIYATNNKPDSVTHKGPPSFIWAAHRCAALTTYPSGSDEQPSIPDIFGLSTHKVYPMLWLPKARAGSYPAFSPLPRYKSWRLFSAVLAVTRPKAGTFPLGSMVLCVVRTFLYGKNLPQRQSLFVVCQRTFTISYYAEFLTRLPLFRILPCWHQRFLSQGNALISLYV